MQPDKISLHMRSKIEQEVKDDGELDIKTVVEVIEGNVDDLESFLNNNDISYRDLERLKQAEIAAKDRKTAKRIINNRLDEKRIDERIRNLEKKIENSQNVETDESHLEIGKLRIEIVNGEPRLILDTGDKKIDLRHYHLQDFFSNSYGSVQNAESFVTALNEIPGQESSSTGHQVGSGKVQSPIPSPGPDQRPGNPGTQKQVEQQPGGRSEKAGKTGATEKQDGKELEDAIKEEAEKEAEAIEDELSETEKLKNELKEKFDLKEEDLEGKDKEELEDLKERLSEKEELRKELREKYGIEPGDKDIDELEELKEKMEKIEDKREELLDRYDIDEERAEGKNLEQLKDLEDDLKQRQELENRLKAHGFRSEELEKKEIEELQEMMEKFETKKNISEDLGLELGDDELRETELEQLKSLKKEREERKRLIESLKDEGFEEENLENSSTDDLRKLEAEIESRDQERHEVRDEEIEEMEDEAQEDIELLQGAVTEEDQEQEEEASSYRDSIDRLKQKLEDFKGSEDEEQKEDDLRKQRILEKLDSYKDSNNFEKSVKTAQFMKAYLEKTCNINRELTYSEISEELENQFEGEDERIKILSNFFRQINDQIYSGNVYIENIDEVIEISQNLIRGID